jgi:hypothetical protein
MKHNHAGGITVLLFDAHLHPRRLCTFPKMGEIFEPLACARRESNIGRGCVKQKQLRVANSSEPECSVKRWFARLLKIYCAEDAREVLHAITSVARHSVGP